MMNEIEMFCGRDEYNEECDYSFYSNQIRIFISSISIVFPYDF